jgi:hypothetical protein
MLALFYENGYIKSCWGSYTKTFEDAVKSSQTLWLRKPRRRAELPLGILIVAGEYLGKMNSQL